MQWVLDETGDDVLAWVAAEQQREVSIRSTNPHLFNDDGTRRVEFLAPSARRSAAEVVETPAHQPAADDTMAMIADDEVVYRPCSEV